MSQEPMTLSEAEEEISRRVAKFLASSPTMPREELEWRFVQHILPPLRWGFLAAGTAEAERTGDPNVLHRTLARFVSLTYRGIRFDEKGICVSSGSDYCELVHPSIWAAAAGRFTLVRRSFHSGRSLSKTGDATSTRAANLLVILGEPGWRHREEALARAEKRLAAKSAPAVDKSFLQLLLALSRADGPAAEEALEAFGGSFLRSDWGRHRPYSKPLFLYGLFALARELRPGVLDRGSVDPLLGDAWADIWRRHEESLPRLRAAEPGFTADLAFLEVDERTWSP